MQSIARKKMKPSVKCTTRNRILPITEWGWRRTLNSRWEPSTGQHFDGSLSDSEWRTQSCHPQTSDLQNCDKIRDCFRLCHLLCSDRKLTELLICKANSNLDLSNTRTFDLSHTDTYYFTLVHTHALHSSCSKCYLALGSRWKVDKIPFKTDLLGFEFLVAT